LVPVGTARQASRSAPIEQPSVLFEDVTVPAISAAATLWAMQHAVVS
jgi:hypothetical protein